LAALSENCSFLVAGALHAVTWPFHGCFAVLRLP
jgi:hypothetical protein